MPLALYGMSAVSSVAAEFTSGVRYRPRIRRLCYSPSLSITWRKSRDRQKREDTGLASLNSATFLEYYFGSAENCQTVVYRRLLTYTWHIGPIFDLIFDHYGTQYGPDFRPYLTQSGPIWDPPGTILGPIWDGSGTGLGPV